MEAESDMPNSQRQFSRVCLRYDCSTILMLEQIPLTLVLLTSLPPPNPQYVVLPATDCRMLLNQKGVGQREAVYLTPDPLLWSFIP